MVAVLKPIDSRAIERPMFSNSALEYFNVWLECNRTALARYYRQRGKTMPQSSGEMLIDTHRSHEFLAFAQRQWEHERMQRDEMVAQNSTRCTQAGIFP